MALDWNVLTLALDNPNHLPDLSKINEYRQFIIEAFKHRAVKDLRLVFQHYFEEFSKSIENYNSTHYRNQIRLRRKHPAVDRVITYILNDPHHTICLKDGVSTGELITCLQTAVDAYFEEQGMDWLIGQFELTDYERPNISRPQFITKFIKLCHSGHRREVWRAIRDFSEYIAINPDLIENDLGTDLWNYRRWIYHNMNR